MAEVRRLRPKYVVARLPEMKDVPGYRSIEVVVRKFKGEDLRLSQMCSTDPTDVDSPFVLMPRKDPAAFEAMRLYAVHCEPPLGNEIRAWLRKISEADPVYGTQGKRNRTAMRLRVLVGDAQ